MTLILTKVATDGVVMAADSVLTEEYGRYSRFLSGATKLFLHGQSRTCLGTWGHATLPASTDKPPVSIEFVIRRFLDEYPSVNDADQLSSELRGWLQNNFMTAGGRVGIDLASTKPGGGKQGVVVYRLENTPNSDITPRRAFERLTLREAGPYSDRDSLILPAGGDINADFWVARMTASMRESLLETTDRELPDDCFGVAAWLPAVVRSVSDMYNCLNVARSIGGPVATAIIPMNTPPCIL